MLRDYGLGDRLDREGNPHDGTYIVWAGSEKLLIDTYKYNGKKMTAYGQTAITEDLYAARDRDGGQVIHEAGDVTPLDLKSDAPYVTCTKDGAEHRIDRDFVAGCDGFHGVSRRSIPAAAAFRREETMQAACRGSVGHGRPTCVAQYAAGGGRPSSRPGKPVGQVQASGRASD